MAGTAVPGIRDTLDQLGITTLVGCARRGDLTMPSPLTTAYDNFDSVSGSSPKKWTVRSIRSSVSTLGSAAAAAIRSQVLTCPPAVGLQCRSTSTPTRRRWGRAVAAMLGELMERSN